MIHISKNGFMGNRKDKSANKKYFVLFFVFLLFVGIVNASESEEIQKGEQLVKSRVSCTALSEEELESIGEYYMELMHPGKLHEIMDERMGGEGTETLRQVHINIAKMMYCGDRNKLPQNMMNIMMNRGGYQGMMGFTSGYGMMSYLYPFYGGWNMLLWIIIILVIVYFLIKYMKEGKFGAGANSLEILKRRYAEGEITRKEFEQIKKELK